MALYRHARSLRGNVEVIEFLKEKGLLATSQNCIECDQPMLWRSAKAVSDGFTWRCQSTKCSKYNNRLSIRHGSFFAKSRLRLEILLRIILNWAMDYPTRKICTDTGVSRQSLVDYCKFLREVCSKRLIREGMELSRPAAVVETDRSYCNMASGKLKRMKGTSKKMLPGYLDEFMWRKRFGSTDIEAVENIIRDIATQYPLQWVIHCLS